MISENDFFFLLKEIMIKVKLFPANCSCGNQLGSNQKKYEDRVLELFETGLYKLSYCQNQALNDLGWFRMCCRNSCWNYISPNIVDSTYGAFTNEISGINGNFQNDEIIIKNTPEIVPKREIPSFQDLPGNFDRLPLEEFKYKDSPIVQNKYNIPNSNTIILPKKKNFKIYAEKSVDVELN